MTLDELLSPTDKQEHRQHKRKPKSKVFFSLQEAGKLVVVVFASFLVGTILTNAGLYTEKINELIHGVSSITMIKSTSDRINFAADSKQQQLDDLFKKQQDQQKHNSKDDIYAYYNNRANSLDRQFNTLPPDKRIVIPDLGIQAPIVMVEGDTKGKMQEGEFAEELKQGVVHYPTTPKPGEKGTMMLFGHTSNYFWVKSAYNTVFSKIPQLKAGSVIKVYRDGKEHEYIVTEQEVVKPNDVPWLYEKKYDSSESKLAIMGCYPIGTRDKRMIIFAKPKNDSNTASKNLAYNAAIKKQ